ncbi:MAG: GIY-YIG nuclease family protein [Clostridia bacterium]|nr:GIY-YIG nuclease family protein [Clostridia bacterium]
MSAYFVYLLECCDGSLYCGYTNDVEKRVKTHNDGQGAKYTKSRLPVKLAYFEEFSSKSDALKRECAIKKLTKPQKLKLIKEGNIQKDE